MARVTLNDDNEDRLFRLFEDAQGLQRRVFRILARRHFNEHAVNELRSQVEGMVREIAYLAEEANDTA
jgi:hypothetical protein